MSAILAARPLSSDSEVMISTSTIGIGFSKSRVRHPGAKDLMQNVPQKQFINDQVSLVAVRHDNQARFPFHRRDYKRCKPRVTSAMHDEVPVLCMPDLPAQSLRD